MLALSPSERAASIICARQPGLCCTSTSGSRSANGSCPTSSRAHHTAWPSPSGSCWRVKLAVPGPGRSRASASRSARRWRSVSVCSSSNWRSKWSSITALLRPVTKMKCSMPASRASSTTCWISGRSTTGSISFGMALVAGRKRVPRPATGKTALRIGFMRAAIHPTTGDVPTRQRCFQVAGAEAVRRFSPTDLTKVPATLFPRP